ncbi:MAG: hypothetical protein A2170_12325, partial [Deltaproteobacteria bacterium RBG_13_53_10]
LTPSFISQLEKNLISPSLDSLLRLSEKLDTQPIYFLTDEQSGPWQKMIIKPRERQEVHLKGAKVAEVKLQLLVSDVLNRRMEPYLVSLKKGGKISGNLFNHRGDGFAYVMEGDVEVEIQGEKQVLRQGDSIYIGSTAPTRWINTSKGETVLLWVLSPPREGG